MRKVIKIVGNILKVLIVISITFYLVEIVFFPKKAIEVKMDQERTQFLDVNYKLVASKRAAEKDSESNGWYVSDNEAQQNEGRFSREGIFLRIDTEEDTLVDGTFIADRLYLVNNSEEKLCLPAQDSRLYLTMQAKNILGAWNDIEYLPNSWCGNSYHEVCLSNGEFWEFASLQFRGRYRTKYRYRLDGLESSLFSNEVEGYINSGQFVVKQEYLPLGV